MANARSLLLGLVRSRRTFLLGIGSGASLRPMHSLLPVACYGIASSYKPLLGFRCFSSAGPHIVLEMPALSPTMNQGNIAKWRKQEGDKINVGDVLCEIETDKATLEFESLEDGYLAKILVPEGSKDVPVGQPIAITVEDPDELKNVPAEISKKSEVKEEKSTQAVAHKESSKRSNFSRISQSAKLLITEHGLEASSLKASGPRGTLLKGDVLEAIKSGRGSRESSTPSQEKPSPSTNGTQSMAQSLPQSSTASPIMDAYDDLPNTQIRKVIAKRLLESKQSTPHLYLSSDVVLDPLLAFRKELKDQHNVKVSVNDIVIKAVAIALKNVPEANACWNAEKGEASLCDSIDIAIAVATEKGLMTPIIRNADQKSLSAISSEVKELAEKARSGKLAPHQFQGGTFRKRKGEAQIIHQTAVISNNSNRCFSGLFGCNRSSECFVGRKLVETTSVAGGTLAVAVVKVSMMVQLEGVGGSLAIDEL